MTRLASIGPGHRAAPLHDDGHPRAASGSRRVLALVVGAGIVSAFQVGKVPTALPALQQALAIDLSTASWLLSAFALVGAVFGLWIGLSADAWGARRLVLGGLAVQGLCSALGAAADAVAWLLVLRTLEGIGFLAVVVAAPSLILAATPASASARSRAFAAWGMFMPLGVAGMMLAAPALDLVGWRGLWAINAGLLLAYVPLLARATRGLGQAAAQRLPRGALRSAVAAPAPWLLAALFALFCAAFFSVFGFLPSILSERLGVAPGAAGMLSAAAVAMSAVGNLACGALLARGASRMRLLALSFIAIGAATAGLVAPGVPGIAAYALCLALAFVCGLIPVVLMDAVPRHAPSPELVGATMGLAMQGNNLGLVIGPAAAGAIAGAWGWPSVAVWVAVLALAALALVRALRRMPGERAAS